MEAEQDCRQVSWVDYQLAQGSRKPVDPRVLGLHCHLCNIFFLKILCEYELLKYIMSSSTKVYILASTISTITFAFGTVAYLLATIVLYFTSTIIYI